MGRHSCSRWRGIPLLAGLRSRTPRAFLLGGGVVVTVLALVTAGAVAAPLLGPGTPGALTAAYQVVQSQNTDQLGTYTIHNGTGVLIGTWRLSFDLPPGARIANMVSGDITVAGQTHSITATRALSPNDSLVLMLQIEGTGGAVPVNCRINDAPCDGTTPPAPSPASGPLFVPPVQNPPAPLPAPPSAPVTPSPSVSSLALSPSAGPSSTDSHGDSALSDGEPDPVGTPVLPPAGDGTVFFQEEGTVEGWDNKNPKPQKDGVIRTVSSPTFKGPTAIEYQQTYISSDGKNYHSENVKFGAQKEGEDRYYGQAIYLANDWPFHGQPVCFQQWSPEEPSGPWLLMHVAGDTLKYATRKTGYEDITSIAALRGTWIRIVTRIKMSSSGGALEIWVNGEKVVSETGDWAPPNGSPSIRWSSGLYPTYWDTEEPEGQRVMSIFHDHARIASTYELAEPANW